MIDFFISYTKADQQWAEWIAWRLEEEGYSTLLQAWDFRPGGNFAAYMQQGAAEAERTIAVLSPDYLDARFATAEWLAAFAEDPTGETGKLLPIRVRKCELKGLLGPIIYIDLIDKDEESARQALLAGVKKGRAKPTTAPEFPGGQRSVPKRPRFPGALPPIWNVPRRNPNFTGRTHLMEALRTALTSGKPAALTQAIHGLGGVGKTQLAREYAYRFASDYDLVWWVQSEEAGKRAADYAALAQKLDLPEKDEREQPKIVAAVRERLEHLHRWLVIFDNVPHPDDVRDLLPRGESGHVIVTSRDPNWKGLGEPLQVVKMHRDDSVDFLLKRTGQSDAEAAHELAEELGDFPLMLEQAAAYMDSAGRTLGEYLGLWRSHREDVIKRGVPTTDYDDTVATTWELSFQQVEKASAAAVELLYLCSCLAPDDIPRELITDGAEHLPETLAKAAKDPLLFDDAVAALRRYSLVEVDDGALSLHRLVQAVTRDRLSDEDRQSWGGVAVGLVNARFPQDSHDVRTWSECSRLLPHARLAVEHPGSEIAAQDAASRILNQMGLYLKGRAEFAHAQQNFERALEIAQTIHGAEHLHVGICLGNLGRLLYVLGDLARAKEMTAQALAILEKVHGPEHPHVATALSHLGMILDEMGDVRGARLMLERSLGILESIHGPEHFTVEPALNNLGLFLYKQRNLDGAESMFQRSLAISESTYGLAHPAVATALCNLSSVLQSRGDCEEAKAKLERALAIDEKAYGTGHPEVANDLNNLATILYDMGDLKGARVHLKRALIIFGNLMGVDHPKTQAIRRNLDSLKD